MKTASSDLCGIAAASSSQVTQRPEIWFNDFISDGLMIQTLKCSELNVESLVY